MLDRQKKKILALLKRDEANGNYENNYWFSYKDFLDPIDEFTAFSCENFDGKQRYLAIIENLLHKDESAKIFVQVYGYEEDSKESFIYADILIIFSRLPLIEIKQIFYETEELFPSSIGEAADFSKHTFLVDDNGDLLPITNLFHDGYSVYYCWWD